MTTTKPNLEDVTDFADADRGLVARLEPGRIRDDRGRVVWDADAYAFLEEECPDTAAPSLWRQSRLCARQGLFEVVEGIYQIRGFDLSNMTLVEGDTGVIVIDPLVSAEPAAAGLDLYRRHRGERPVTGVVYTHSHIDHFGGVGGVTDGDVPILAPAGFMENAVAENVYAGPAMTRRGLFHTGTNLERGPAGQIGVGLGQTNSTGTVTLIAPNRDITRTGQEEAVDGVRFVFQMTPGTEAPSEMNFHLPDRRALCMAENATHTLHNVLTLRGAPVRDARAWSRYLDEAVELFGRDSDVLFASHHWPTWGAERLVSFLSQQRDMYAYLHDQTLRMLNSGFVGTEIAELIQMPPGLEREWHTRGYYGSVSHNVKAVYQRYMGWFDGNPAHLWEHPPAEEARRYVDCMGGVDEVVRKAGEYRDAGDLRFAATLLDHAVYARPDDSGAKAALAGVYEALGHGAECGTWRNFYLQGAAELRGGGAGEPLAAGAGMAAALTVEQLFDSLAIRVDGPRAWEERFAIDWDLTDLGAVVRTTMSNGALIVREDPRAGEAGLRVTLTRPELLSLIGGGGGHGLATSGDASLLGRLFGLLEEPDPVFPVVTPRKAADTGGSRSAAPRPRREGGDGA
ncbi:alkyl sulfatase dimerization domain-containing protein [Nocardiopsis sp. CT-R113]|uniref:Alkyl sulfatase dimerization domain-containing protein n=1 Tax=Nocardiopsis codii TaxID=3065942 RepID=A0ABU7K7N9_9ACTN|nr:alkyl sulfatase dimerization domain-containing protein [Nocardiopsis sp. CT-R113]MEE2038246.1 alkyl sulfatase dimerization domain-containing protein [Nocardiopsis sp. CT-R113]